MIRELQQPRTMLRAPRAAIQHNDLCPRCKRAASRRNRNQQRQLAENTKKAEVVRADGQLSVPTVFHRRLCVSELILSRTWCDAMRPQSVVTRNVCPVCVSPVRVRVFGCCVLGSVHEAGLQGNEVRTFETRHWFQWTDTWLADLIN